MKYVVVFLLAFASLCARAEIDFPFILPAGDEESLLGNAGYALTGSPGNVLYNPAGLAELKGNRFSASGSAYANVQGRTQVINQTVDYSSFVSEPNMLVASRQVRSWTIAFGIFVPITFEGDIESVQPFPLTNGEMRSSAVFKTDEQYIGLSTGKTVGSGWRLGGGLFAHRYTNSTNGSFFVTPNSGSVALANTSKWEMEVTSLLPVLGVQKDFLDRRLQWGLRVLCPSVEVLGRGRTQTTQLLYDGSTSTPTESDIQHKAHYRTPTDVGTGIAWRVGRWRWLGDVSVQFPVEFDDKPGSSANTHYHTATTARWNLGAEYSLSDSYLLDFGTLYSPFTNGPAHNPGDMPANFSSVSAGLYTRETNFTSGVGFFYTNSRRDGKYFDFARDPVYGYSAYGVILTSSIRY